jgi:hypothetical protein
MSMAREMMNLCNISVKELQRKRQLDTLKRIWKASIKINLRDDVDLIELTEYNVHS